MKVERKKGNEKRKGNFNIQLNDFLFKRQGHFHKMLKAKCFNCSH